MNRRPEIQMFDAVFDLALIGHQWGDKFVERELPRYREAGLGDHMCDGCREAGCCQQPVMCTFIDALPIAFVLDNCGLNTFELRQQYGTIGMEMEAVLIDRSQADKPRPCVFLNEANECSIYHVRPMICRVYFAFKTREACRWSKPATTKSDMVCILDHSEAMGTSMMKAVEIAEYLGMSGQRAWIRALPLQVAVVLEALAGKPQQFWKVIETKAAMPTNKFMKIAEAQLEDERDGKFVREEIEVR